MSKTTCASCHQTIPDRVDSIIPHSPESRDDQVAFIHRETRRLDQLIPQLSEERVSLLRRLNAIQSLTAALPTETLSSIFEYTLPCSELASHSPFWGYSGSATRQFPQFTLGAVSSRWHQVVQSTPRMWTTLSLDMTREDMRTTRKTAALLEHFIKHSKQLPFNLALIFSEEVIDRRSPQLVHENVDSLLIGALPRVQEPHLINPPVFWQNYTTHLTQLRKFTFRFNHMKWPTLRGRIVFPSSAPLYQLSINEALWLSDANTQPPWATLTSLYLSSVPPDSSIQVFIQCPSLIKFHCSRPLPRQQPLEQVTLTQPISFQHLTSFHWETEDTPWSRALVQHLHVPILKDMHWSTFDTYSDNKNDIRAFFDRLPPTLKTLTLDGTASNVEYIRDDSNIDTLTLHQCRTSEFRMLFRKLRVSQLDGRAKPLPLLEDVKLTGNLCDEVTMAPVDTLATTYSAILVYLLEQRLDESLNSFTLYMQTTVFQWKTETRERLRKLVNKGYYIDIIEITDD